MGIEARNSYTYSDRFRLIHLSLFDIRVFIINGWIEPGSAQIKVPSTKLVELSTNRWVLLIIHLICKIVFFLYQESHIFPRKGTYNYLLVLAHHCKKTLKNNKSHPSKKSYGKIASF